MTLPRKIYWVTLTRFDTKRVKSTWVKTCRLLVEQGFNVNLLCGFANNKNVPNYSKYATLYFRAVDFPLLFRITLS